MPAKEHELALLRAEVEALRAEVGGLHSRPRPVRSQSRWRRGAWLTGATVFAMALLGTHTVHSQSCGSVLPAPMNSFCAGTPASASDVNDNFAQLVAWLEAKTGTVGQTITLPSVSGDVSVDGNVSLDNLTVDADSSAWPGIRIGASGGGIPDFVIDGNARGTMIRWGNDNAFFGMMNRGAGGTSDKDAVIYYGDDTNDSLRFWTQDNGNVATLDGEGGLTAKSFNGKTLSGAGLTCRSEYVRDTSPTDDEEITATCDGDEVVTGCSCYSSWNNCDGAYTSGTDSCVVRAGGGGSWLEARAVCCKLQ